MSVRLPVDHVILLVPDLEAAGSAFESAGFQVTPQTRHIPAMGTANRCVMLAGSYIEIMGIVAETPANATWRALLAAGAGIRGLALHSTDIEQSAKQLVALDIPAEAVRHFSRITPDGELRFSVTRIDPAATPGLQCLVCQHHTPELLWRADAMFHANGTLSLRSIGLPQAPELQRFGQDDTAAGVDIHPGNGRLVLSGHRPQYYDLRTFCGVEIEVLGA